MTPELVIELMRDALWLIVTMALAIIGPGLMVGLVVSTFQAATQINEQTLSFLPRLIVTLLVLIVWGPWLLTLLLDHTNELIKNIPNMIG